MTTDIPEMIPSMILLINEVPEMLSILNDVVVTERLTDGDVIAAGVIELDIDTVRRAAAVLKRLE